MDFNVQTVLGPKTATVSKEDALVALQTDPNYPGGAIISNFDEKDGQWVATLRVPKTAQSKEAAPPPPPAPADEEPSGPPAPSGPPKPDDESSDGPPSDEGEEKPPSDSEDGPPKPGEGEGKPNVEHQLGELTGLLHQIAEALGVGPAAGPPHPGAGPEVGGPPAPPAPGGPPSAGRPPTHGQGMMRSRPLKPGEAPNSPGVTPVGAPAFASVADDHPWKPLLGKVATFTASNEVEDDETSGVIARATSELNELAGNVWDKESNEWVPGPNATGYKVAQVREGHTDDGRRVIKALISAR